MTTTLLGFAKRMDRAPTVVRATAKEMVRVAALAVTVAERQSLSSASHGSNRLSGVGRKGAKLSVGFNIKGTGNPTAIVAARGPWHLIENNTRPHTITVRKRRRGGRALVGRGFGPVASVNHPGTKGKHPWAKGEAVGIPVAIKESRIVGSKGILKAVLG